MEIRKWRVSKGMTVGQWLERTIWELRHPKRLLPSSNWQVYLSLLHKLQREGVIIDLPVAKVGDRTFRQLIRWLRGAERGVGFEGTMKTFAALMRRARKARLTRYAADFPYRDFMPRSTRMASAASILAGGGTVASLSREQWEAFLNLDLSVVPLHGGPHTVWLKELYRDFCILLYELKSRPIDVLQLRNDNIAFNPETKRFLCSYIPAKKRNYGEPVVQYLSTKALGIVEKYRGRSGGGYVLPFAMNARRWNVGNAAGFEAHYKAARNQLARINRFLDMVGRKLELPFAFTLYSVRRSALTHAVVENRIPLPILAKMAGTSVRMIEKHYTNYLHAIEGY